MESKSNLFPATITAPDAAFGHRSSYDDRGVQIFLSELCVAYCTILTYVTYPPHPISRKLKLMRLLLSSYPPKPERRR